MAEKSPTAVENDATSPEETPTEEQKEESFDETTVEDSIPKRRGRPKKRRSSAAAVRNTKSATKVDTPDQDGSGNEIKLRRRDRIKTTSRYSPELPEPKETRRGRGRAPSIKFPSTATSSGSKYISFDSDEEVTTRKKKSDSSLAKNDAGIVNSLVVDVKKDEESNKLLIMLPNGITYKVDPTPGIYQPPGKRVGSGAAEKRKREIEEDDEDYVDDGAVMDDDDEEFVPIVRPKRKRALKVSTAPTTMVLTIPPKNDKTSGRKRFPETTIALRTPVDAKANNKLFGSSSVQSKLVSGKITTPINRGSTPLTKSRITIVNSLSPSNKSPTIATTNPSFKQPPKRNYGSSCKYIDEQPDLGDCTSEDVSPESSLSKLPDKVLLVESDLPLQHSLVGENKLQPYLFRQLCSPLMTEFACLLCTSSANTNPKLAAATAIFKQAKDLIEHYSAQHELVCESSIAKFSDEIVFVCLPRVTIDDVEAGNGSGIIVNTPCQYCEQNLETVAEMKRHYTEIHQNDVKMVEQEEIFNMHKYLYCSLCEKSSDNFSKHHQHMKNEHKMHTLVCKSCVFTTMDGNRLKTHYKARHIVSNSKIHLQCAYCNGLVTGMEGMNKHIMASHCIRTGHNEFSCMQCLQVCEKSDDLMAHAQKCCKMNSPGKDEAVKVISQILEVVSDTEKDWSEPKACFFCDKSFINEKLYRLHMEHIHTQWSPRNVLHDTFLLVKRADGKTDLMPSTPAGGLVDVPHLKLEDIPSMSLLEEAGVKGMLGHYCDKCEKVIEIYPLYYLHMYNVHKLSKVFECKVSSCRASFKDYNSYHDHSQASEHPQYSVVEDPLKAIACHYCNVYFANEKEMETHHLSDEHFNKVNQMVDKSGNKPEPKNHRCKVCHTPFGMFDSFIYHMENENHHYSCRYCGLFFALPYSRRTHIQIHHNDKSDICEFCFTKQGSKERLLSHLVEHNVVFECDCCMRKFFQREQLNAHMDNHGDPLICPWQGCGKTINRSHLMTHIRQHRIENESKCTSCGKTFNNKQALQAHMDVHVEAEANAKAILSTHAANMANRDATASTCKSEATVDETSPSPSSIAPLTPSTSVQEPVSNLLKDTPVGTTLISITTPPTNMTVIKQRAGFGGNKGKIRVATPVVTSARDKNNVLLPGQAQAEGSRIVCFDCNQMFDFQKEIPHHKCVVPEVTITGNTRIARQLEVNTSFGSSVDGSAKPLVASVVNNGTPVKRINEPAPVKSSNAIEAEKLVRDIAAQLRAVSDNRSNKKETIIASSPLSSGKSIITSATTTNEGSIKKAGNIQSRFKKNYSSPLKSPATVVRSPLLSNVTVSEVRSLAFSNEKGLNDKKPLAKTTAQIDAKDETLTLDLGKSDGIVQLQPDQQTISIVDETVTADPKLATTDAAPTGEQYIMLQQPDGQLIQICVPEGMNIEDVVQNFNISFATDEGGELMANLSSLDVGGDTQTATASAAESTQAVTDGTSSSLSTGKSIVTDSESASVARFADGVNQAAAELVDTEAVFVQQTANADEFITAHEQHTLQLSAGDLVPPAGTAAALIEGANGEQQLIYLPVNEDGTYEIDANALAMLTGANGEVPVIVTSNN